MPIVFKAFEVKVYRPSRSEGGGCIQALQHYRINSGSVSIEKDDDGYFVRHSKGSEIGMTARLCKLHPAVGLDEVERSVIIKLTTVESPSGSKLNRMWYKFRFQTMEVAILFKHA